MSTASYDPAATADERVVAAALSRYGLSDRAGWQLINLSENATYRIDDPTTGRAAILRVHRPDYHTHAAIASELAWLSAVGAHSPVATPTVIATRDDDQIVTVPVDGVPRHAVLFEVLPGAAPVESQLGAADFETLGEITAHLHRHARGWQPPGAFVRFAWNWHYSLGDAPRWGRWQDGIGVGPGEEAVLGQAADLVRSRLADYGTAADRYGLIHADLRLANLLVHGDQISVIDFDDCGHSWFMYDFGAAVSFIEHDPRLPDWQDAWLRGYRRRQPLSLQDEEMLPTFVMMRRLLLVAWLGSHSHSRECQELGPGYTMDSCELAERYLQSDGQSVSP